MKSGEGLFSREGNPPKKTPAQIVLLIWVGLFLGGSPSLQFLLSHHGTVPRQRGHAQKDLSFEPPGFLVRMVPTTDHLLVGSQLAVKGLQGRVFSPGGLGSLAQFMSRVSLSQVD